MIKKYRFGDPFQTDAVVNELPVEAGAFPVGNVETKDGFRFTFEMGAEDIVYGLGENVRGINKRGFRYISFCTDDPHHQEDKSSLYAAHNFLIVDQPQPFGLFLDYPGKMTFDVGYTKKDVLEISCERADLDVYVLTGDSPYDIVKQFRGLIGRSYLPPRWAFGFGQSRWGYQTPEDFRKVAAGHRENGVPIDMIYMDIDYMDHYKDFTVDETLYPDFSAFVEEMKQQHIHLIPIIDAGVKEEAGYDVYEEGVEKGYFCRRANGSYFEAAVWPGLTHFPDFLNPEAREWFGEKYKRLTDAGIDGFWNDMNEPAIFYTPEGQEEAMQLAKALLKEKEAGQEEADVDLETAAGNLLNFKLANRDEDYRRFYHQVDGKLVNHYDVHNLFGYNMTRAAGEAFTRLRPEERTLMFSRSSYIGMHRYGGIWMGDNKSWWSHLLMNLKMLPSLNMCGILYTGADLGGFGADTSRDLVLRWLALGVFTPLMRNHAAKGTREQECYQFEQIEDFADVIKVRYRLLPYLYSEFMKAALRDDMMFRPLAFDYPEDEIARHVEDQLMLGHEVMIAPVVEQNAIGRCVYLPEEMTFLKFLPDGTIAQERLSAGMHFIKVALNEVPMFVRSGCCVPIGAPAMYADAIDMETLELYGDAGASYELYTDDGLTMHAEQDGKTQLLRKSEK